MSFLYGANVNFWFHFFEYRTYECFAAKSGALGIVNLQNSLSCEPCVFLAGGFAQPVTVLPPYL